MSKFSVVKFFTQKLTFEEKLLCLIPIFAFYIDMFATFIGARSITSLMAFEANYGLTEALASGQFALFIFIIQTQVVVFLAFTLIIYILKFIDANTKIMYAIIFTYVGLRINGAWSWFI